VQNVHRQIAHNNNKNNKNKQTKTTTTTTTWQANSKLFTQNPPTQQISNNKEMDPLEKGLAQYPLILIN